jgi:DNA-binding NarL/FixJ family response regulator
MKNIRIIIADDHAVVRQGLRAMLSPRNGMEVIAEAENGREAERLAHELAPDVIVMDLVMPEVDGVEATAAIKAQNPDARILVLTSFEDQQRAADVIKAGASGYILKDAGADELIRAIRTVHGGQAVITPHVMKSIANAQPDQSKPSPQSFDLTPREMQVLEGIMDGLTNQAIALRLGIRPTTVRSHVSSVLTKLNVTNRTQAALVARERHLLNK